MFKQSETVRKEQTLIFILILITTPIIIIILFLLIFNLPLFLAVAVSIVLDLMLFFQFKLMTNEKNRLSLKFYDEFFERRSGSSIERINYQDITKGIFYKNKQDEVTLIKLFVGKNKIGLVGFNDMNRIGTLLLAHIPSEKIEFKAHQIQPVNLPALFIVSSILIFGLIFFLLKTSLSVYDLTQNIFIALFGIFLLFFKPLSTYGGKKKRKLEIIFGTLLLLDGLLSFFFN